MSQLIIGNQLTEETAEGEGALPSDCRRFLSVISHRMVWFAQDGDVLVLPSHPGEGFLEHVRRVNGSAEGEPLIVVPPPGRQGAELLYDDRLAAPEFVAGLRTLIAERGVDRVFPFHLGAAVLRLARETGLDGPFGGVAFLAERGGELVNREAAFRAVAAGNAVPKPDGRVPGSVQLDAVARRAVREDYQTARVLISRNRVPWLSFTQAEALLDRAGLDGAPAPSVESEV